MTTSHYLFFICLIFVCCFVSPLYSEIAPASCSHFIVTPTEYVVPSWDISEATNTQWSINRFVLPSDTDPELQPGFTVNSNLFLIVRCEYDPEIDDLSEYSIKIDLYGVAPSSISNDDDNDDDNTVPDNDINDNSKYTSISSSSKWTLVPSDPITTIAEIRINLMRDIPAYMLSSAENIQRNTILDISLFHNAVDDSGNNSSEGTDPDNTEEDDQDGQNLGYITTFGDITDVSSDLAAISLSNIQYVHLPPPLRILGSYSNGFQWEYTTNTILSNGNVLETPLHVNIPEHDVLSTNGGDDHNTNTPIIPIITQTDMNVLQDGTGQEEEEVTLPIADLGLLGTNPSVNPAKMYWNNIPAAETEDEEDDGTTTQPNLDNINLLIPIGIYYTPQILDTDGNINLDVHFTCYQTTDTTQTVVYTLKGVITNIALDVDPSNIIYMTYKSTYIVVNISPLFFATPNLVVKSVKISYPDDIATDMLSLYNYNQSAANHDDANTITINHLTVVYDNKYHPTSSIRARPLLELFTVVCTTDDHCNDVYSQYSLSTSQPTNYTCSASSNVCVCQSGFTGLFCQVPTQCLEEDNQTDPDQGTDGETNDDMDLTCSTFYGFLGYTKKQGSTTIDCNTSCTCYNNDIINHKSYIDPNTSCNSCIQPCYNNWDNSLSIYPTSLVQCGTPQQCIQCDNDMYGAYCEWIRVNMPLYIVVPIQYKNIPITEIPDSYETIIYNFIKTIADDITTHPETNTTPPAAEPEITLGSFIEHGCDETPDEPKDTTSSHIYSIYISFYIPKLGKGDDRTTTDDANIISQFSTYSVIKMYNDYITSQSSAIQTSWDTLYNTGTDGKPYISSIEDLETVQCPKISFVSHLDINIEYDASNYYTSPVLHDLCIPPYYTEKENDKEEDKCKESYQNECDADNIISTVRSIYHDYRICHCKHGFYGIKCDEECSMKEYDDCNEHGYIAYILDDTGNPDEDSEAGQCDTKCTCYKGFKGDRCEEIDDEGTDGGEDGPCPIPCFMGGITDAKECSNIDQQCTQCPLNTVGSYCQWYSVDLDIEVALPMRFPSPDDSTVTQEDSDLFEYIKTTYLDRLLLLNDSETIVGNTNPLQPHPSEKFINLQPLSNPDDAKVVYENTIQTKEWELVSLCGNIQGEDQGEGEPTQPQHSRIKSTFTYYIPLHHDDIEYSEYSISKSISLLQSHINTILSSIYIKYDQNNNVITDSQLPTLSRQCYYDQTLSSSSSGSTITNDVIISLPDYTNSDLHTSSILFVPYNIIKHVHIRSTDDNDGSNGADNDGDDGDNPAPPEENDADDTIIQFSKSFNNLILCPAPYIYNPITFQCSTFCHSEGTADWVLDHIYDKPGTCHCKATWSGLACHQPNNACVVDDTSEGQDGEEDDDDQSNDTTSIIECSFNGYVDEDSEGKTCSQPDQCLCSWFGSSSSDCSTGKCEEICYPDITKKSTQYSDFKYNNDCSTTSQCKCGPGRYGLQCQYTSMVSTLYIVSSEDNINNIKELLYNIYNTYILSNDNTISNIIIGNINYQSSECGLIKVSNTKTNKYYRVSYDIIIQSPIGFIYSTTIPMTKQGFIYTIDQYTSSYIDHKTTPNQPKMTSLLTNINKYILDSITLLDPTLLSLTSTQLETLKQCIPSNDDSILRQSSISALKSINYYGISSPIPNDGLLLPDPNSTDDTNCLPPYSGKKCNINRYTLCHDTNSEPFDVQYYMLTNRICKCKPGYIGEYCTIPEQCKNAFEELKQCSYRGIVTLLEGSTTQCNTSCTCNEGYSGDMCQNVVQPCDGKCDSATSVCGVDGKTCQCRQPQLGWTLSSSDPTKCERKCPCLNKGTCTWKSGIPTCDCTKTDGFDGLLCQNKINTVCNASSYAPKICDVGTIECDNQGQSICKCSNSTIWSSYSPSSNTQCSKCNMEDICDREGTHRLTYTRSRCIEQQCICKQNKIGKLCNNNASYSILLFNIVNNMTINSKNPYGYNAIIMKYISNLYMNNEIYVLPETFKIEDYINLYNIIEVSVPAIENQTTVSDDDEDNEANLNILQLYTNRMSRMLSNLFGSSPPKSSASSVAQSSSRVVYDRNNPLQSQLEIHNYEFILAQDTPAQYYCANGSIPRQRSRLVWECVQQYKFIFEINRDNVEALELRVNGNDGDDNGDDTEGITDGTTTDNSNTSQFTIQQNTDINDSLSHLYDNWSNISDTIINDPDSTTNNDGIVTHLGLPETVPVYDPVQCAASNNTLPGCDTTIDYNDTTYDTEAQDDDDLFGPILPTKEPDSTKDKMSNVGIIIGIVVGACVVLILIMVSICCCKKKQRGCFKEKENDDDDIETEAGQYVNGSMGSGGRSSGASNKRRHKRKQSNGTELSSTMHSTSNNKDTSHNNTGHGGTSGGSTNGSTGGSTGGSKGKDSKSALPQAVDFGTSTDAGVDTRELPDDWKQLIDPHSGKVYYFNQKTLVSSWIHPLDDQSQSPW